MLKSTYPKKFESANRDRTTPQQINT